MWCVLGLNGLHYYRLFKFSFSIRQMAQILETRLLFLWLKTNKNKQKMCADDSYEFHRPWDEM